MVVKASEAFWRKLQSLAFISDTQIKNWRMLAQNANISWLELCQRIQTETVLGPNQLEILADPVSTEAVAVGPFVIQRRLVHPSGWPCFEVLHAQLRQSLKLTWLPSEAELHNALLTRVRQVALLTDDVTATIRDMDSRDGRTYVIQPMPQGPRLSELAASRESKAWLTDGLVESLVKHVFGVLDSKLELGRLDPVNLWLEGPQGLKHDLLSAPWIDSESIPVGLAPQESAWLLTFRAARRRWESEQGSDAPKPQHPVLELASWLAGWSLPQATPAEAATFARWKHAAVDLWETVVGGSELAGWREHWFPMAAKPVVLETAERGDRKPDTLVSQAEAMLMEPAITMAVESESHVQDTNRVTTTAVNELGDDEDLGGCSEEDGEGALLHQAKDAARETSDSADAATPSALSNADDPVEPHLDGSLEVTVPPTIQVNVSAAVSKRGNDRARESSTNTAARLKKRKATEQKRRLVTALAIALPFPIFLVGFLLAYLFWPAEDRVPDTPQSNASSPLPESGLPATSGPASGNVENTPAKSAAREPGQQDDTNAAALLGTDDDAMLAGLDGDEEAELPLDDLNLNDTVGALGLDELSDATLTRTIDPVAPIAEVANSADSDGGAEPPTTSSPAGAPPEPANTAAGSTGSVSVPSPPPSDFQFDEPFASFSHLIASADFQTEGRGLGDRVSDGQRSYHMGWLNRATAQRVRLDWRATSLAETGDGSPQVIESPRLSSDRETPGASTGLRKWRLVLPPQNDTLATMEVAPDGQVRLSIEDRQFWDIVPQDGNRLIWSYRDLEHEMRFDQGASPVPTDRTSEDPTPDRQVMTDGQSPPATVAADDSVVTEIESSLNAGRSDAGDAETNVFDDRPFDTRTATLQSWSMETPEWPNGEEPQWRFWLGGEALVPLDKEHPMWQAVRFRGSEQPYVLEDEFFDTGSVVVTLQADSGRKARLAGKLHLVTPNGLVPLKAGVASQEALAADNFKMLVQRQRDQLNSVRAKPGEGDRKRAELDRMDAVIKEVERYRKALDRSVENQDRWLEKGLAFSLARQVDGQSIEWAHSRGRPEPEEKKD